MKQLPIALVLPLILSACGGNSGSPLPLSEDQQAQQSGDNCTTPYFQEIAGVYDGEIAFERAGRSSCRWDVDFEVTLSQVPQPMLNFCETLANITSTLLTGDTDACGDIAQAGGFSQPISGLSDPDELELEDISFPIEGNMRLNAQTPSGQIFPTGLQRPTSIITVVFDGLGNVTFPESPVFSGVLVKQYLAL